jgi:hypothetical protein
MFTPGEIVEIAGQKYQVVPGITFDDHVLLKLYVEPPKWVDPRIQVITEAWHEMNVNDETEVLFCHSEGVTCRCVNPETIKLLLDALDKFSDEKYYDSWGT